MNCKFLICLFFASSPCQCSRKIVVRARIPWLQLDGGLQRRDGVRKSLGRQQCATQPEKCVAESGIQFGGPREMLDGIIPLTVLARQLPEYVFRSRVVG